MPALISCQWASQGFWLVTIGKRSLWTKFAASSCSLCGLPYLMFWKHTMLYDIMKHKIMSAETLSCWWISLHNWTSSSFSKMLGKHPVGRSGRAAEVQGGSRGRQEADQGGRCGDVAFTTILFLTLYLVSLWSSWTYFSRGCIQKKRDNSFPSLRKSPDSLAWGSLLSAHSWSN